jgi:hypothetical protein
LKSAGDCGFAGFGLNNAGGGKACTPLGSGPLRTTSKQATIASRVRVTGVEKNRYILNKPRN